MVAPTNALAQAERAALCATAREVGPDAPTLCEGWDVRALLAHLAVREGSPAAVGIAVPFLSGLTEHRMARTGRDFDRLLDKVRSGPPRLSPYAVPRLDRMVNTLEFFVHHEDIRRAQPDWAPRSPADEDARLLWAMTRSAGKALTRKAPVGVAVENAVTGSRTTLSGDGAVTVRGLPGEVAMFLFGRKKHARVELLGDEADVARLRGTSLGI